MMHGQTKIDIHINV